MNEKKMQDAPEIGTAPAIKIGTAIPIPDVLKKFGVFFARAGFKAYLVGGAVRDMLMHKRVNDYDIGTDALPQDVMRIFRRVIPTGIEHGTVTVLFGAGKNAEKIEVTTFRSESGYTDGRHPDSVSFCADITSDLSRRDFTINAIAADLQTGKIIDPYFGAADIQKKIVRTVGNPFDRFSEDYLRPIRAIRFSSTLQFAIEERTLDAITALSEKTKNISIERFRDEFEKMLMRSAKPSVALRLLEECGILKIFIPELTACRGVMQNDYRNYHKNDDDILEHLFFACDTSCDAPPRTPHTPHTLEIKLAAILHDVGKPVTRNEQDGKITFFGHEKDSAVLTERILKRLKFSNHTVEYVCHLVKNHMFHYERTWSNAAVRRFLVRALSLTQTHPEIPQQHMLRDLFALHYADSNGRGEKPDPEEADAISEFKMRIQELLESSEKPALSLKDIALNGKDLLALGVPAGKRIGEILQLLHEKVIAEPQWNTKEKLTQLVSENYLPKQQS